MALDSKCGNSLCMVSDLFFNCTSVAGIYWKCREKYTKMCIWVRYRVLLYRFRLWKTSRINVASVGSETIKENSTFCVEVKNLYSERTYIFMHVLLLTTLVTLARGWKDNCSTSVISFISLYRLVLTRSIITRHHYLPLYLASVL